MQGSPPVSYTHLLAAGESELASKEQELNDAQAEYDDAKSEADTKIKDGEKKIKDAEKDISKIEHAKWYINDRSTLTEYTSYGENADRMKAIGEVFPVLFFLVAALISLTTMTRMVEEQRTQIGTLKALGYEVGGFDAVTTSRVLKGSGLSSSAAFEVLVVTILSHLYNDDAIDQMCIRDRPDSVLGQGDGHLP